MRTVAVAAPVVSHLAADGTSECRLTGVTSGALYLQRDDFVIAITAPGIPLMPNGIAVAAMPRRPPRVGVSVSCGPASLEFDGHVVRWRADAPPLWQPGPPDVPAWRDGSAVAARGAALLRLCGVRPSRDPETLAGAFAASRPHIAVRALAQVLAAVRDGDACRAAAGADALLGCGPGLTPEGDDVLAGIAATVAIAGEAAGFNGVARREWLGALCPSDAASRSSALSVTLLRLAIGGHVTEPVAGILDPAHDAWRGSLRRLVRVGSSTGPAYAFALGATAMMLGGCA